MLDIYFAEFIWYSSSKLKTLFWILSSTSLYIFACSYSNIVTATIIVLVVIVITVNYFNYSCCASISIFLSPSLFFVGGEVVYCVFPFFASLISWSSPIERGNGWINGKAIYWSKSIPLLRGLGFLDHKLGMKRGESELHEMVMHRISRDEFL